MSSDEVTFPTTQPAPEKARLNGSSKPLRVVDPPPPPPPPPTGPKRPVIRITAELERDADAAIAALSADGKIYQRSGALAHVTQATAAEAADERAPVAKDSPVIHDMAQATLLERLASCATWIKYDARSKEPRQVLPSAPITSAVFNRKEWAGIRRIVGVVTTPTMRPDGTIVQSPGYDASTGYLYAPNDVFPPVADHPSKTDAEGALAILSDLFIDFPFVDAAARMVPIAALLTMLARPAILGAVPCFAFDSPTRGTGKGLSATVAVEIATGRASPLATFPSGAHSGQDELEKMLAAYALSGAPIVFFDNIPIGVSFGGAPLEKVLTAPDVVSLRVLGRSETPTLPWRAVVLVAGNNLTIADETARRVLVARMVSTHERPEERAGFRYPDLLAHVRAHRPALVVAALTILRAYTAHGSPDTGTMLLGSYEPWSRIVPQAIVFAGGADIMGARVTLGGDTDGSASAHAAVLDGLARCLGDAASISASDFLSAIYPAPTPHEPPDGFEEARSAIEGATGTRPGSKPATAALGTYLRGIRDRICEGRKLVAITQSATTKVARRWRLEAV